ncbi:MAG: nucleoside deaminase [Pseudomonadota bacterium]|nr:nucleoside deaminase [Pseudomonadota bacterium]
MNGPKVLGADDHQHFMRKAILMAERSLAAGGPPVGSCLVRDGTIIGMAQNSIVAELDVTAHAEIVVIREACRGLQTLSLSGTNLYVTVEPCAMCFAACHYAAVEHVYFGASIDSMHAITSNELSANNYVNDINYSLPKMTGGVLESECVSMLDLWGSLG